MLTNSNRCATELSIAMSRVKSNSAPLAKIAKLLDYRQIKDGRTAFTSPLKNLITIDVFKNQKPWNQIFAPRVGWQQNIHRHRLFLCILNNSDQLAIVNVNVRNLHVRDVA